LVIIGLLAALAIHWREMLVFGVLSIIGAFLDQPPEIVHDYDDYLCVDPNLTWNEEDVKLLDVEGRGSINSLYDTRLKYYEFNEFDKEEFIATRVVHIILFGGENYDIVLVSPDKHFSPWRDWTAKKLTLEEYNKTYTTNDKQVFDDFAKFVQNAQSEIEETNKSIHIGYHGDYNEQETEAYEDDNISESIAQEETTVISEVALYEETEVTENEAFAQFVELKKEETTTARPIGTEIEQTTTAETTTAPDTEETEPKVTEVHRKSYNLTLSFEETEDISWKSRAYVIKMSDGSYKAIIGIAYFSRRFQDFEGEIYNWQDEWVEVPIDTPLYNYLVTVYKDSVMN
jgi:hypothetical protein